MPPEKTQEMLDHDLLISIDTKLENALQLLSKVTTYVPAYCMQHASKIEALEKCIEESKQFKADANMVAELGNQLNQLRNWVYGLAASVIVITLGSIVTYALTGK